MSKKTQKLSDQFNEAYIKATKTSKPEDYGEAAMIARQMVCQMGEDGSIKDNYERIKST